MYRKIVLFFSLLVLSHYASASILSFASTLAKMDVNSASFFMSAYNQKEQFVEDDRNFYKAKKLLPVTYEVYTLTDMEKSDDSIYLEIDVKDQSIVNMWHTEPKKLKKKFYNGVCRIFRKYNFKTIKDVTVKFSSYDTYLTTIQQKKSSCKKK